MTRFGTAFRTSCGALVLAAALAVHAAAGQTGRTPTPIPSSVGVLLVAHGATAAWNAPVESLAVHLRHREVITGPVGVTFLMGDSAGSHPFQDVVASLVRQGATRIVAVPVLVSSYSGHYRQLEYLSGHADSLESDMMHMLMMSGITRPHDGPPITVTPALDDSPELAHVLAERARGLVPDPSHRALFLLGHGPNSADDDAEWMKNLRVVADSVRAETGFASVLVGVVRDDAPPLVRAEAVEQDREIIQLQAMATRDDVAVVAVLVSDGSINERKFPHDLAGLPVVYNGTPILPDTSMAAWVERRVREAVHQ